MCLLSVTETHIFWCILVPDEQPLFIIQPVARYCTVSLTLSDERSRWKMAVKVRMGEKEILQAMKQVVVEFLMDTEGGSSDDDDMYEETDDEADYDELARLKYAPNIYVYT